MTITRDELLSALFGYLCWLMIVVYFLIYRPIERAVESVRMRL